MNVKSVGHNWILESQRKTFALFFFFFPFIYLWAVWSVKDFPKEITEEWFKQQSGCLCNINHVTEIDFEHLKPCQTPHLPQKPLVHVFQRLLVLMSLCLADSSSSLSCLEIINAFPNVQCTCSPQSKPAWNTSPTETEREISEIESKSSFKRSASDCSLCLMKLWKRGGCVWGRRDMDGRAAVKKVLQLPFKCKARMGPESSQTEHRDFFFLKTPHTDGRPNVSGEVLVLSFAPALSHGSISIFGNPTNQGTWNSQHASSMMTSWITVSC